MILKILAISVIAGFAAYILIPEFRIRINEYMIGVLVPPPQ